MLTAAALLELDFEQPSLDYHSLMKLTKILTRDNEADVREMFRRMCFNVFAHNREKGTAGGGDAGRSGKKLVRGSNRKDEKYGGRTVGKIFIEVEV